MRFVLLQEGDTPTGASVSHRPREMIREAIFAEEMEFDCWGISEHHAVQQVATVSAPELLHAVVAYQTSRIKIRSMSTVMLPFNHPIRTAERVATLDILSHGRFELGTARGNNATLVNAFGYDMQTTREQYRETMQVYVEALTKDVVNFDGDFYKVVDTTIVPRLYSRELPPMYVSATSLETHEMAGQIGIGAMSGGLFDWDYYHACAEEYRKGVQNQKLLGDYRPTNSLSALGLCAHCAPTKAQALAESRPVGLGFARWVGQFFAPLAESSPDYAYMGDVVKHLGSGTWEELVDGLPYFLVGAPDEVIEKIKLFESLGYSEMVLRIDGLGHKLVMQAIEMFGKYVIPEFRSPRSVERARSYQEFDVEQHLYPV
jgi:alkanesulfonate monooxygenase SsuD/methylene tetrahydromethanopterin reductase-like flavin-dependent oxidoreductase (luciferase family)